MAIVKEIVLKHIPQNDYAVFLFGSRAAGSAGKLSDIDVGIMGNKPVSAIMKLELEDELDECIVPYKIDIIDFFNADTSFKKEALSKIELWNCPPGMRLS